MKNIRQSADFRAVLFLLLLWIFFFWRIWTPVEHDQLSFAEGDFSGQFVAWTDYAVERLKNGEIPLWNPYQYAGAPFQADPQTALTYPPRMLTMAFLLLESDVQPHEVYAALQWEVMIHVLLASLFVYVFARRLTSPPARVRVHSMERGISSVWGGVVAAVTYAYGGYLAGYPILQVPLLEAGIWLPLVLLGIFEATQVFVGADVKDGATDSGISETRYSPSVIRPGSTLKQGGSRAFNTSQENDMLDALKTRPYKLSWGWMLFSAVMLGLSLLAGHPQTSLFTIYVAVAWLLYRVYPRWRLWFIGVIFLGVVSGALAAVQLIPTAEFSLQTSRVDMTFEARGGGFSFAELSNILFPLRGELWNANYIGLVALVLVGIAVWRRVPYWKFFTGLLFVSFFLSFGQKTALYGILYTILPGLAFFRGQERVMFIMAHSAAVLVGLATVHLMTPRDIQKPLRQSLLILLAVCVSVAFVFFIIGLTEFSNRAVEDRLASAAFSALVFALMLAGLPWFLQQPGEKWRMTALIGLLAFDLFSANAMLKLNYEPVPVSQRLPFPEFLNEIHLEPGQRIDGRNRIKDGYSTLYRVPDISGSDPLQLATIRTYLEEIPIERQWEILSVADAENPRQFAHPVYGYYQVASDEEAYGFLREPAFDVRHLAILEKSPGNLPENLPEEISDRVTITRFEPETIEIEATVPQPAILTLALPDYPGWQAEINGNDTEILRNYGGLSAVYLPEGTHRVTLNFRPRWLPIAAGISGAAWVLVLIALMFMRRKPVTIEQNQGENHHG